MRYISRTRNTYMILIFVISLTIIGYEIYQCINIKKLTFLYDTSCYWPPLDIAEIENDGAYNVTICIKFNDDSGYNSAPKGYPIGNLFFNQTTDKNVTFEELGMLPRELFRNAKYPDIYRTYPQDVPMKQIVQRIKEGLPVSYEPNYNFPIRILKTSKSVCYPGTKHDLVIIVKNAVYNIDARKEFREFMKNQSRKVPKLKVGAVFSIGVPRNKGGRIFLRNGKNVTLEGPAGDGLEKYKGKSSELMKQIQAEIAQFGDIILADYEDTYFNLSWKTVTNLRWVSGFCDKSQGDFFMIIDDDHRVNLQLLTEFAQNISRRELRRHLFGRIGWKDPVFRSSQARYFMTYSEVPWNHAAPYPRGMSQLIGADIVDDMAIATAYTKHNYLNEDVYLGILAQKLNIKLENVGAFYDHNQYSEKPPPIVAHKKLWH